MLLYTKYVVTWVNRKKYKFLSNGIFIRKFILVNTSNNLFLNFHRHFLKYKQKLYKITKISYKLEPSQANDLTFKLNTYYSFILI